ncbi:MAG: hypothetical protein IJB79_03910 [Candidatus Gastranaerophilales bacterium]|nr:hypothetical protein [Candidatus Gastranaerophilales bacterium]
MKKSLRMLNAKAKAFTVAEALIAVLSIGFVSLIALGLISKQVDAQKTNVARVVLNNEFAVSLASMHADKKLVGITNEKDFADRLQQYMGITGDVINKDGTVSRKEGSTAKPETYDNFVAKNFAPQYMDNNGAVIKASNYNTVFQTDKGASVALSYKKGCTVSQKFVNDMTSSGNAKFGYEAKNEALACVEGIYDVNGLTGPNKFGVDVDSFNPIKGDCPGENWVMGSTGQCNVCSITSANCKADNKTLDKENCACKCTRKCPKGTTLDEATCTCKCPEIGKFNEDYCTLPKEGSYVCQPVLIKASTPTQCTLSSGKWKQDTCDCICDNTSCFGKSYGYGIAKNDPKTNSFCACRCKYKDVSAEFQAQVRANAMKDGITDEALLKQIVSNTVPANHDLASESGCYACKQKTSKDGNITYEMKNGYCAPGCTDSVKDKCSADGGFFNWVPYDPKNPTTSCRCACNIESKEEQLKEMNKQLASTPVLAQDSTSKTVWNQYSQAYECGAGLSCSSRGSCTYCSSAGKNSTVKRVYEANKNKGKPNANDAAKYTFDRNICAYKIDTTPISNKFNPNSLTPQVHFHGAHGNYYGWAFYPSWAGKTTLPNPNANRPKGAPGFSDTDSALTNDYWKVNLSIKSTYSKWADPIVLNYTNDVDSTSRLGNHMTSKGNEVSFALHYNNGKYETVKTPWIQAKDSIDKSHLFLVTLDSNKKVPDVSYMFSDQKLKPNSNGDLYKTGLEQLLEEFDTTKDSNKNSKYAFDTGLINKNDANFDKLFAWWDKNTNAVVDKGEIFSLDDLKIVELNANVIRQTDELGEAIQDDNAIFGIKGQYKRLIKYTPTKSSGFAGFGVKYCHVVPVYDKNGKQILDKWELDVDNSSSDCETYFGKVKTNKGSSSVVKEENEDDDAVFPSVPGEKASQNSENNAGANDDKKAESNGESADKSNDEIKDTPANGPNLGHGGKNNKKEEVKEEKVYVKYSPRVAVRGSETSEYKETWFKEKDSSELDNTSYSIIKLYKIGKDYYTEQIFNLNDVIFKFED